MGRRTYTPEQIINKLREAEILLNQGNSVGEASKKIGVTEQTYYRWRKEYGGMRVEQARSGMRCYGAEKCCGVKHGKVARPGDSTCFGSELVDSYLIAFR